MSWIISFLIDWGYWGMLAAAFLAGSFFPFSSEAVMAGLQAAGLEPLPSLSTVASAMCLVPCSTTVWAEWVRWNG